MKYLKEEDCYVTTDLVTAGVLVYFEHTLETIDKTTPSRCKFVIARAKHTDNILELFHKRELKVEPKTFNAIQREIKTRLYNE